VTEVWAEAEQLGRADSQLESLRLKALIGFAQMDIVAGPVKLVFGRYNFRPLNEEEGNKLYQCMIQRGFQRTKVDHAIPLVIPHGFIDPSSFTTNPNAGETLPEVKWTEAALTQKNVIAAGGRHRHYAVQRFLKQTQSYAEDLQKKIDIKKGSSPELQGLMEEAKKMTHAAPRWIVALYQQGKSLLLELSYAFDDLFVHLELVDRNRAELGQYLAQNLILHIFKETADEGMMKNMQNLLVAKQDGDNVVKEMKAKIAAQAKKSNSQNSGVYHSNDAMEFYLSLLALGDAFHTMPCLSLKWAEATFRGQYGGVGQLLSPSTL
jgi:hypothetical protein